MTPVGAVPVGEGAEHVLEAAGRSAARRLRPSAGSTAALDRLADLAARLLGAPAAQLSLLSGVQLIAGCSGLPPGSTGAQSPVKDSLAAVTAAGGAPLVVTDARADPRVAHLPPVTSGGVGSYLGAPLTSDAGHFVGALCVFGPEPRPWSGADVALLVQLADAATAEMELTALSGEFETNQVVLGLALSAARIGVFDLDVRTRAMEWDDRLVEMFGFTREEFESVLDAWSGRLHPADRQRVTTALADAIASRGEYDAEYRIVLPGGAVRWIAARGQALCDESGATVRVLGAAYDVTARRTAAEAAERAATRSVVLARVAAELAASTDADTTLARLPQIIVPAMADWCIASAADPGHEDWRYRLRAVSSWHGDPSLRGAAEEFRVERMATASTAASVAAALSLTEPVVVTSGAMATAEAALHGRARDLLRLLAPDAAVALPLLGREQTIGLLTVCNGAGRGSFSDADLATLREIAVQAGLGLDNAKLHAAQRDLAEELQRSLLTALPELDGLQITARYAPAARGAQIGGDWYDAFTTHDGSTALVVGDVVGHDRAAAVAMAGVRNVLRGIGYAVAAAPAAVLALLDQSMRDLAVGTLTTAVLAKAERVGDGWRLVWSNAGHPPPLLLHAGGAAELLARAPDLLLGLSADTARHDHSHPLPPGATVLLYSDGLVERRGEDLTTGLERLRAVASPLAGAPLDVLCDELVERLAKGAEDDVALLALRTLTAPSPGPLEVR